jgi:hypothetical protein
MFGGFGNLRNYVERREPKGPYHSDTLTLIQYFLKYHRSEEVNQPCDNDIRKKCEQYRQAIDILKRNGIAGNSYMIEYNVKKADSFVSQILLEDKKDD